MRFPGEGIAVEGQAYISFAVAVTDLAGGAVRVRGSGAPFFELVIREPHDCLENGHLTMIDHALDDVEVMLGGNRWPGNRWNDTVAGDEPAHKASRQSIG